jgi:hypothetical protein
MNENLQNQIINELIIIAGIMSPLMVALKKLWKSKLKEYFSTKINSISNEDLRNAAQAAYDTLKDLIPQEITNAEITLKPAILQAIADGKVDKNELCTLNGIVKDKVLSQLTEDAKNALKSKIPDINSYLKSRIEDVLSALKLDPTSVVSKTVIPEVNTEETAAAPTISLEEHQAVVNENNKLKSQLDAIQSTFQPTINVTNSESSDIVEKSKTTEAATNSNTSVQA